MLTNCDRTCYVTELPKVLLGMTEIRENGVGDIYLRGVLADFNPLKFFSRFRGEVLTSLTNQNNVK